MSALSTVTSLVMLSALIFSISPIAASSQTIVFNLTHHVSPTPREKISPSPNPHPHNYFNPQYEEEADDDLFRIGIGSIYDVNAVQHYFAATVWMGSEHLKKSLMMDTGSYLSWIKCQPCCSGQRRAVYSSTTVGSITKWDPVCRKSFSPGIDDKADSECRFEAAYANAQYGKGALYRDHFSFQDVTAAQKIVFGCAEDSNLSQDFDGVMGLGPFDSSLVKQLGSSKFAYCLGNLLNTTYQDSKLLIGNRLRFGGKPFNTPLIFGGRLNLPFFYVNIELIRLGDTWLDIDPSIFKLRPIPLTDALEGGVIIDTGSKYTILPDEATYEIVYEVDGFILHSEHRLEPLVGPYFSYHDEAGNEKKYYRLCYKGNFETDLVDFPNLSIKFEGGAIIDLQPHHIFEQSSFYFCLAILPTLLHQGFTNGVLGSMLQRDFYVGYDLEAHTVSFEPMDCAQASAA